MCPILGAKQKLFYMKGSKNMEKLTAKHCAACRGDVPPLQGKPLLDLYKQLDKGWELIQEHHIEKKYVFKNFRQALDFTNKVGELAEKEGHHPDIHLSWGKVKLIIWTHKIDGLTESDFILAAKCDEIV